MLRDGVPDDRLGRDDRLDREPGDLLERLEDGAVGRIDHGDRQHASLDIYREDLVQRGKVRGDGPEDLCTDGVPGKVHRRNPELLPQEPRELGGLQEAPPDQDGADLPAVLLLLAQGILDVRRRDQVRRDEHLSDGAVTGILPSVRRHRCSTLFLPPSLAL